MYPPLLRIWDRYHPPPALLCSLTTFSIETGLLSKTTLELAAFRTIRCFSVLPAKPPTLGTLYYVRHGSLVGDALRHNGLGACGRVLYWQRGAAGFCKNLGSRTRRRCTIVRWSSSGYKGLIVIDCVVILYWLYDKRKNRKQDEQGR